MKKTRILVLCILALFTSCKKDGNSSISNISASIDGKNESFNSGTVAQIQSGATKKSSLVILGLNKSSEGHKLGITLKLGRDITAGSYTTGQSGVNALTIGYQFGPDNYADVTASTIGNDQATIVITSVTDHEIKGTFSGDLTAYSPNKVKITGEFDLSLR